MPEVEPLERLERRGRSLSVGMASSPTTSPGTNLNPRSSGKNNNNLLIEAGQRLRAATSFSPHHPPSSMAVRRVGSGGKSLAAIAGPMGITVVDVDAPQRPWMVLNYSSSSLGGFSSSSGNSGGISTMAFQPCPSTAPIISDVGGGGGHNHNYSQSSPILLATARGSGILIWDCSGRALSPLLGRLNASDSGIATSSKARRNSGNKRNVDDAPDGQSTTGSEGSGKPPSAGVESNAAATQDTVVKSSVTSPIALERQDSLISVTSTTSLVKSSNANVAAATGSASTAKNTTAASSPSKGDVTSLDWKGPSAPILLSTCGNSACIWDLRTSLFSGLGVGSSSGARPNSRFISPEDGLYNAGSSLIHCAYAQDESKNVFATLDTAGVVRVWDDRKADRPKHSFLACPGGSVGIASLAQHLNSEGDEPRWVTWGVDELQSSSGDNLVVKVWTAKTRKDTTSSSVLSENTLRKNTASTISSENDAIDRNEDMGDISTSYHVTSCISMEGAAAARVHPSFPDGILLFRDNRSEPEDGEVEQTAGGYSSTPTGLGVPTDIEDEMEGIINSPNQMILAAPGAAGLKMRTPEIAMAQMPPSPPPLMLEETEGDQEPEKESPSPKHEGWEAELWRVDTEDSALPSSGAEKADSVGAQKIASFCGGGVEEDTLSFAPGRGDVSDVIAVDLALGKPVENGKEELSLCVLTKAGRFTAYGVPEATELLAHGNDTETAPNKRGRVDMESNMTRPASSRVYRQDHHASPWWNKNEEEDLFGDDTEQTGPKKAARKVVGSEGMPETIAEKVSPPSIIRDVDLASSIDGVDGGNLGDMSATGNVQNNNLPVDRERAARVLCPPLCGVAFSGVGELVTFNNGPVKRMWSYYQTNTNETLSPSRPSLSSFSFKPHLKKGSSVTLISTATSDEEDSAAHDHESTGQKMMQSSEIQSLPRTLADLIDMNQISQTLQWGDNEQLNDDAASDEGGGSSSSNDGSSSYEDAEILAAESDESGSESDDSEGFFHVSADKFDAYFSESRKSLLGGENEKTVSREEKFAGLPSLSPSVAITRKYDDIILSGQTPQLANLLNLGDIWWLTQDFSVPNSVMQSGDKHPTGLEWPKNDNSVFHHNLSDPHLSSTLFPESRARSSSVSELPKSPSKKDSMMGKMKKLFIHQLPTAMTPPDQRLMNSKARQKTILTDQHTNSPSELLEGSDKANLGVYVLENPQTPEAASERLAITHKLCIHNAQVYSSCGQKAKGDTWMLLAQTIESIYTFEMDETDGWGGEGDALTTGIVEQILRYYEVEGDFQMLSTIVCVLSFGRDRRNGSGSGGSGRYQLLPKCDERRYDNYLHRYATLLYGWGLLTVRCEVAKRFAYSTPGAGSETITQLITSLYGDKGILSNSGEAPGITFTPLCSNCNESVTDNNNVCQKCNNFAFQCSICCSAVRGACTWCPLCGHGGHVDHMMQWFKRQEVCPTGCGCTCKLG